MIARITGRLTQVLDDEVRIEVGGIEYQILVPEFVRRRLQMSAGEEITLSTMHFLEGNPMQGRLIPRLVGFCNDEELAFFDAFCSVEKVGVRKALRALARPVADIAQAIYRKDAAWLTSLPGVGKATAEQVIGKLQDKVARFLTGGVESDGVKARPSAIDAALLEDSYQALLALGHTPSDARERLDRLLGSTSAKLTTVEEVVAAVYRQRS